MKTDELKWLDSCPKCGKIVNVKTICDNKEGDGHTEGFYKEFGYVPWDCDCGEFNNLRNN